MPTVKKSKAGLEDLLLGQGVENQSRSGGTYPITKLDLVIGVESFSKLQAFEPTFDGQKVHLSGLANGTFSYSAADTTSVDDKGTIAVTPLGKRWKREDTGVKSSRYFGAAGDFVPSTNTGTDDTLAMQALFDSLKDGDTILLEGNILIDRATASVKTVQGVASYICVADGKKHLKVTGAGTIYQRYSTLDTIGVCFLNCDDLNLDMPVFDGNFRYAAAQPITFKQQLLHIIGGKRHKGGFTVRNSANVGFVITNQFGDTGAGFKTTEVNNSIYHTIISENCLQNSTFGTGVNRVTISSLSILNPVVGGIKLSSRTDIADNSAPFRGVSIGSLQVSFDSTYKIPNNEGNTALNSSLAALDYVSSATDVHVGSALLDFTHVTIPSIAVKQNPQTTILRRTGPLRIDYLSVRNQTITNSAVLQIDNESTASSFGTIECEAVSKVVEITNTVAAAVQPRDKKWLDVDRLIVNGSDRLALSVVGYTADYVRVGVLETNYLSSYALQSVRVDASCNLNALEIGKISTTASINILGVIHDEISIKGTVDCKNQASGPLFVSLTTLANTRMDLSDLNLIGDGTANRVCTLQNVGFINASGNLKQTACPKGISIINCTEFNIGDNCNVFKNLTVLQPWQFTGTLPKIQGIFSYPGSPNSTQIGDIGNWYRRQDGSAGASLYIKTVGNGTNSGWNTVV